MLKNTMTFLVLFLVLTASAPLSAQERVHSDIPPAVAQALDREPPLSQADIDACIKIMPELTRLLSDPMSAEQVAAGLNLSQIRFSYIMAKVPLAMALASGADPKILGLDSLPQALRPSQKELRLVKDNLDALSAAADEAGRVLTEAAPGLTAQ